MVKYFQPKILKIHLVYKTSLIKEVTLMENNEILFTPAGLLDFLRQIDELSDKDISVDETGSTLTVTIGESSYGIVLDQAQTVEAPDDVVDEVAEVADEAYAELGADGVEVDNVEEEPVEGGIISEALKTLAVGGLVRLTSKLLGKDLTDNLK